MKIHGSRKIKINKINITSITKQPYMKCKENTVNQQRILSNETTKKQRQGTIGGIRELIIKEHSTLITME